jgi:hypothetical protein
MKKTLLIFAMVALTTVTVFGQNNTDYRRKVSVGLKGGINLSNVYDSEGEQFNSDAKMGLAGGLFVSIPLGSLFGIQPEILFSQKGYQGSGSILGSSYSYKYTSNFVDVPLLIAFKPVSLITILAGPQYSFLVSDKYVFNSAVVNIDQQNEFENDNIRKNILCFIGGADINFSKIVIGARVGWDIQDNKGDGTSETPRYKNVWYQATIGFRF